MNRKEYLMNCIAEGIEPAIEAKNHEEMYLAKIAKKSASGGSGGGVFIVTIDEAEKTIDKNEGEIFAAFDAGMVVVLHVLGSGGDGDYYTTNCYRDHSYLIFTAFKHQFDKGFLTNTMDVRSYVIGGNSFEKVVKTITMS